MSPAFAEIDPPSLDDALRRCAAGERACLRVIYDREAAAMIGVAMRILRRRELAEEAVHDTFARSWLYAVLRHRALNILRGERRTDQLDDFDTLDLESGDESPEACVARLSDTKALRHCLEKLEPARRHAIVLAYVQGLTHGELAGRLGVPLGTVKSWIRRSLVTLKECMA
jgi:RNA polymerase sigma factor (sigma-70 family)